MQDTVYIPRTVEEASRLKNIKWACETTKILDAQKINWSLYYNGKNQHKIDAFNYGDGVVYDLSINQCKTMVGKIYTQEMTGDEIYTDVVLQKGTIKYMSHREGTNLIEGEIGDILLKINSFIYLNFNKFTGYVRFQNIGKYVVSITLHVDQDVLDLYGKDWENKLLDVYSGKTWK